MSGRRMLITVAPAAPAGPAAAPDPVGGLR